MKIKDVTQIPTGTILSFASEVPNNVVGGFVAVNETNFYKIKGTPTNVWTELYIEKTNDLEPGQEVKILKTA